MDSVADVVVFTFRDSTRAAEVATVAGQQRGVRSVAVIGRVPDREIRIITHTEVVDARWVGSMFGILDALSRPLHDRAGPSAAMNIETLSDSAAGFTAFGRLVPRSELVLLIAVCDGSQQPIRQWAARLGAVLFRAPDRPASTTGERRRELT